MRRNSSQGIWTLVLVALAGGVAVGAQTWGAWITYGLLAALGVAVLLARSYVLTRRRMRARAPASPRSALEALDPSPKAATATFADPRSAAAEAFGAESGGARLRRRGTPRR